MEEEETQATYTQRKDSKLSLHYFLLYFSLKSVSELCVNDCVGLDIDLFLALMLLLCVLYHNNP